MTQAQRKRFAELSQMLNDKHDAELQMEFIELYDLMILEYEEQRELLSGIR